MLRLFFWISRAYLQQVQPHEQSIPVHSSPQSHSVQHASVQHEPAVAQQDFDC
jgi:hypothetical protein